MNEKMIEKVLQELKEIANTDFELGETENSICFQNSVYENLKVFVQIEKNTHKIIDLVAEYDFIEIKWLKKLIQKSLENLLTL